MPSTTRNTFLRSDIATLVLGIGAFAISWLAWQRTHTPNDKPVTSTPVSERAELVRIATWPVGVNVTTTKHAVIVIIGPNCRACAALLRGIDSLPRERHISSSTGYIYFARPQSSPDLINVFVTAECSNAQGRLNEYLQGLVLASDAALYATTSGRRLGVDSAR